MKKIVIVKFLFGALMLIGAILLPSSVTIQGAPVACKDVKDAQCTSSSYCQQRFINSFCHPTKCVCVNPSIPW